MSIRITTAALAVLIAAVAATPASARTERHSAAYSEQGSLSKPSLGKNFRSTSSRKYANSVRAKGKAKYAYKGKGKRIASKSSLRDRRFTGGRKVYAAAGSSRSCLQPSARALLNRIESKFGPVSIVSTCRPGAVIATSGKPSRHGKGLAIDFDAGSRKGAIVQWLIANHHSGGTMTYRDMSHIHVDVGPRFVSLGANSGRG